jgi:TonB family protein
MDHENVFSIVLTPLPAKLTVSPSIGGAEVEVFNLETSQSMGHYFHQLNQVDLSPGRYRISTSKAGYRVSMREIIARSGESIYLEPLLEPLPTPTPTPIPTPTISYAPMTFDISKQDKYLLLRLQGSSGDTTKTVGSVNVSLGGPANNYVNGNLNGRPCRVEFVKLENIAEGSIIEAPSPSNNWSAIVVRIRPKDEKRRPISFAINWSTLEDTPFLRPGAAANVFIPAVAIQKVQPLFPPEARGSPISGTVSVMVSIDDAGSVVSARAIDGPYMFRRASEEAARKWKFRPATRDGRNVESQQTIQFKFER